MGDLTRIHEETLQEQVARLETENREQWRYIQRLLARVQAVEERLGMAQ